VEFWVDVIFESSEFCVDVVICAYFGWSGNIGLVLNDSVHESHVDICEKGNACSYQSLYISI
jgi:hypothetical protein